MKTRDVNRDLFDFATLGYTRGVVELLQEQVDVNYTHTTEKMTPLQAACRYGSVQISSALIEAGADVNATDLNGASCITHAVSSGSAELVRMLVTKGAAANGPPFSKWTPLYTAVCKPHCKTEIVKILVESGADFNRPNSANGNTPLCGAVMNGHVEHMWYLLEQPGIDVNKASGCNGSTALHLAVTGKGSTKMVRALLSKGADPNRKTLVCRSTPLHLALASPAGKDDIVTSLLRRGANLFSTNADGETPMGLLESQMGDLYYTVLGLALSFPDVNRRGDDGTSLLHHVCRVRSLHAVKTLLRSNADVNLSDNAGMTALHFAADETETETSVAIAQALVEAGSIVNATRHSDGATALHLAVRTAVAPVECPAIVNVLLRAGADPLKEDKQGKSALVWVTRSLYSRGLMQALLEVPSVAKHINTEFSKEGESTLLYIAAKGGWIQSVDALIQAGANVNKGNSRGFPPLYASLHDGPLNNMADITGRLINAGADVNWFAPETGLTLVHLACARGNIECVRQTLRAGGRPNSVLIKTTIAGDVGESPLITAALRGLVDIVSLLLTAGADWTLRNAGGFTASEEANRVLSSPPVGRRWVRSDGSFIRRVAALSREEADNYREIVRMISKWSVSSRLTMLVLARRARFVQSERASDGGSEALGTLKDLPVDILNKIAGMVTVPRQAWADARPNMDWRRLAIAERQSKHELEHATSAELRMLRQRVEDLVRARTTLEAENELLRAGLEQAPRQQ